MEGPCAIKVEAVPTPETDPGEVRVRVIAAGVGPWDALIRTGQSGVPQSLPLTLGANICGKISAVGEEVDGFEVTDAVYGVTNPSFVGGYAQYALARSSMIAPKPPSLGDYEAASAPVVGVTAIQMLWRHAKLQRGEAVLIHGAAGSVGGHAVHMAKAKGLRVLATARPQDQARLRTLPLDRTVDLDAASAHGETFDAALDLVGRPSQSQLFDFVKPGGVIVSSVSPPDNNLSGAKGVRADFLIVDVDTRSLEVMTELFRARVVRPSVGKVLPANPRLPASRNSLDQP